MKANLVSVLHGFNLFIGNLALSIYILKYLQTNALIKLHFI